MIKSPSLLSDVTSWIRQFITVHDKNVAEFNNARFKYQANGRRAFTWDTTIDLNISVSPENFYYSDGVNSNATINVTGVGNSGRIITIAFYNSTITNRTVTFGTGFLTTATAPVNAGLASNVTFIENNGTLEQISRAVNMP